jgi:hypothetical protein
MALSDADVQKQVCSNVYNGLYVPRNTEFEMSTLRKVASELPVMSPDFACTQFRQILGVYQHTCCQVSTCAMNLVHNDAIVI